jgi:hypothetical protein
MDTVAAICKCKSLSENNLVVAVREKPLESWGFFAWTFNIFMLVVTLGGWFLFALGWVMGEDIGFLLLIDVSTVIQKYQSIISEYQI